MAGIAVAQAAPNKSLEEWKKLREELRKQGWPVSSRVQTEAEMKADIERVRRAMQDQARMDASGWVPMVSNMQAVGGGGVPAKKSPKVVKLQPAKGLR